jgi:hypothetical protein
MIENNTVNTALAVLVSSETIARRKIIAPYLIRASRHAWKRPGRYILIC